MLLTDQRLMGCSGFGALLPNLPTDSFLPAGSVCVSRAQPHPLCLFKSILVKTCSNPPPISDCSKLIALQGEPSSVGCRGPGAVHIFSGRLASFWFYPHSIWQPFLTDYSSGLRMSPHLTEDDICISVSQYLSCFVYFLRGKRNTLSACHLTGSWRLQHVS